MDLAIEKIELEKVVSEAFNIVSYGANKKDLEMLIDIDHQVPHYIWADAMRLKQILVNLVNNALKFTEQVEIKLYTNIIKDHGDEKSIMSLGSNVTVITILLDKIKKI